MTERYVIRNASIGNPTLLVALLLSIVLYAGLSSSSKNLLMRLPAATAIAVSIIWTFSFGYLFDARLPELLLFPFPLHSLRLVVLFLSLALMSTCFFSR